MPCNYFGNFVHLTQQFDKYLGRTQYFQFYVFINRLLRCVSSLGPSSILSYHSPVGSVSLSCLIYLDSSDLSSSYNKVSSGYLTHSNSFGFFSKHESNPFRWAFSSQNLECPVWLLVVDMGTVYRVYKKNVNFFVVPWSHKLQILCYKIFNIWRPLDFQE